MKESIVYSNKSRGLRKKSEQISKSEIIIADVTPDKKSCSKKWASLIKKIYEVNPLECPKCHHEMRIIALIEEPKLVKKI